MSISKLPNSELKVMKYIWSQNKKISSKEIIIEMSQKNNWKQTTTLTVLARLIKKGFLNSEKIGRYSYYEPIIKEDTYIDYETNNFMDTFYQGSLKNLLSSLNDKCKIDKKELEDIGDWLKNLKEDK
ncbi:BlaI/MecI/CopY family transcriptional regulator [Intestinibacter sp.]|uniref:BlaI/MecI/CopY family transcriptional regulator n=1 Tax=Intestinibacter sp. TaxID=1965304 RepID=UPI002A748AED|nr:BlaI/MecI/CopY family transcriptional regulator [Intestinibacter sp.]MDY2734692.1 BlaI/MecI/CopY family transcriptional regulator [Intestinibacter sp.]MDY4574888.1 BlaI/MecI/CopY family transcriptional regulator [Intestinibacter sp.]